MAKRYTTFINEAKSYAKISREEYKKLIDSGHTVKAAGLYEPEHAPKNTVFVHVQLSNTLTKFVRITPPK